jgi:hypothetical protein
MNSKEYPMKLLNNCYKNLLNSVNNNTNINDIPIINEYLGNEIAICIDYGNEILPNNYIKNFIGYNNIKEIPRNEPQLIDFIRNNFTKQNNQNKEIYNIIINKIYYNWFNKIEIIKVDKKTLNFLYFNIRNDNGNIIEELRIKN